MASIQGERMVVETRQDELCNDENRPTLGNSPAASGNLQLKADDENTLAMSLTCNTIASPHGGRPHELKQEEEGRKTPNDEMKKLMNNYQSMMSLHQKVRTRLHHHTELDMSSGATKPSALLEMISSPKKEQRSLSISPIASTHEVPTCNIDTMTIPVSDSALSAYYDKKSPSDQSPREDVVHETSSSDQNKAAPITSEETSKVTPEEVDKILRNARKSLSKSKKAGSKLLISVDTPSTDMDSINPERPLSVRKVPSHEPLSPGSFFVRYGIADEAGIIEPFTPVTSKGKSAVGEFNYQRKDRFVYDSSIATYENHEKPIKYRTNRSSRRQRKSEPYEPKKVHSEPNTPPGRFAFIKNMLCSPDSNIPDWSEIKSMTTEELLELEAMSSHDDDDTSENYSHLSVSSCDENELCGVPSGINDHYDIISKFSTLTTAAMDKSYSNLKTFTSSSDADDDVSESSSTFSRNDHGRKKLPCSPNSRASESQYGTDGSVSYHCHPYSYTYTDGDDTTSQYSSDELEELIVM